jgi:hypothetical protein
MAASDHLSPAQFFHGSDHVFKPGDHIMPATELAKGGDPYDHMQNSGHGAGDPDATYFTSNLKDAQHFGMHVYPVKPLGPHEEDPDWQDGARLSYGRLQVLPHTPESVAATNANIEQTNSVHRDMIKRYGSNGWWSTIHEPISG